MTDIHADDHEVFTWEGELEPGVNLPPGPVAAIRDSITVEAWVHTDAARAEAMMPLVSRWQPATSFDAFSAFDIGAIDGLETRGYFGAVFDGRYLYGCPVRSHEDRRSVHGHVFRYDTHGDFHDPGCYEAYDAGSTDGLRTEGYYGGYFDGRYLIFIPRDDGNVHHSRFLRYDTHADFKSEDSWSAFDAGLAHSFQGGASDGRYLYCCPGHTKPPNTPFDDAQSSSSIMRFDPAGDFRSPASYRTFDAGCLGEGVVCYDGAAFDGRYLFFAPLETGIVLRHDTRASFDHISGWSTFDAGLTVGMGANVGAVFDGRHLYFVPFGNGHIVRHDTAGCFDDPESWRRFDAAATPGLRVAGFKGGFFDGRYIYFIPFKGRLQDNPEAYDFHGCYLRYDTCGNFADPYSWTGHDAGLVEGLETSAYTGGASDGRFLYAAPWRGNLDGGRCHGRLLRYDSLEAGSFSLRYCDYGHNGGLCAAVPGPSFHVNTESGPRSVSAHNILEPGWHHLVGTYDGSLLRLLVDGRAVAARPARGALQRHDGAIAVGHIAGGVARFQGTINQLRISDVARDEDWIANAYRNRQYAVEDMEIER